MIYLYYITHYQHDIWNKKKKKQKEQKIYYVLTTLLPYYFCLYLSDIQYYKGSNLVNKNQKRRLLPSYYKKVLTTFFSL